LGRREGGGGGSTWEVRGPPSSRSTASLRRRPPPNERRPMPCSLRQWCSSGSRRKPCTPWGQPPGVVYLANNDATADELVDLKNEEADPLIYIIL
jgi:hypothetical protein